MNIFTAIILSVVEGITEFLPISSTGHLILASQILGVAQDDYIKTFEIAIQSGAILSVLFIFGRILLKDREALKKTLVAFVPTGIIGFVGYRVIKNFFLGNLTLTLLSLFIGGVVILLFEKYNKKNKSRLLSSLTYKEAFIIGSLQALAVVPGVSRSAATMIPAMILGLSRAASAEFSFLLAIPTMFAATGYDLLKNFGKFDSSQFATLGIGFLVSFLTAWVTVTWFMKFIKGHSLTNFGIYRIGVAIVGIIFLFGQ